ncbi:MAG: glutathione-dependent formaldehyde dehydrogenase [Pseudomonadota bacterium]|nr:glutathione-dependent formaldehyde dehydrogenase [Pseudomonadota bacterium]
MRALAWHGKHDVRVDTVPDPEIVNPRDAIIKITSTAICGSDLHVYDGFIPGMVAGDVLGHEFMGVVEEVGSGAKTKLKRGDKVIVPFTISCGSCFFCQKTLYSCCDNSNPAANQDLADAAFGHSPAGLFGYSHMLGGYAGGQAEYVRVPFADVGPHKVPEDVDDEKVLFLTDILPTGWMAAENAQIEPGDTVAVWGCGPVGLFAVQSAFLMGAAQVVAIDHFPRRLELAARFGAVTLNYHDHPVRQTLLELTAGRGPDSCIDAVGMEAHGFSPDNVIDAAKQELHLTTDRPHALREAILACRKGGTVSVPGVYGGFLDKMPFGAFVNKGLTMKSGQTHVQRYVPRLLEMILDGKIDTTFLISHRLPLEDAPRGYKNFHSNQNEWTKVVLKPR